MALRPGVEAAVHEGRRDDVRPVGQGRAEVVDALAAIDHRHALAHEFLLRVGGAEVVELLAPLVDLVAEVHLHGTDRLARQAERAGRDIARVLLRVAEHAEVDADGAGDEVTVGIAAASAIDGAGVHARTATDALQRLPVLGVGNPIRSAVVDEHDVHRLGRRTGLAEMGGEGGCRLTRAGAAEHPLEHGEALVVGDDLLQTDGGDMQFRTGGGHVGIALVCANHDVACLGDAEITARHASVGCQELVAQAQTGHVGQIGGVVVTLLAAQFLLEEFAHIVMVQVDGGHHDMTRFLTLELDDTFAEVGLHHFYAVLLQVGVHLALLCQHRLRLDEFLYVVVLQDAIDNLIELMGILRPVDDAAVLLGLRRELLQILVEVGDGVALDLRGLLAQLLPLLETVCHIVTLRPDSPESGVMPLGVGLVLQELLRCFTMCCTHNSYLFTFLPFYLSQSCGENLYHVLKLHIQALLLGNARHVHQTRTVGAGDKPCTRLYMPLYLV